MKPPDEALIFAPAKRERVGLIIGLSGPSGSGKTLSALRLGRGIAGANRLALLDTERGRSAIYGDDIEFDKADLGEPFTPGRYADAAAASKRAGHAALIVDSMSHEWAGVGGVLEMHQADLSRLAGDDYQKREAMTMVAWIKPKMAHKAMVQRLLQLNSHLILCFRAEEKTEIQKLPNKAGKLVATPVSIGFQPITSKDMIYEMTILLGFDPKNPGVPIPLKVPDKLRHLIPLDRVVDEETGARLAEWAAGKARAPATARPAPAAAPPAATAAPPPATAAPPAATAAPPPPSPDSPPPESPPESGVPDSIPPPDSPPPEPPPGDGFPGDIPIPGEPPTPPPPAGYDLAGPVPPASAARKGGKTEATVLALIQQFEATRTRSDHLAIVDQKVNRDRINWVKAKRPDLHTPLRNALEASWARTGESAAA